ncbi:hypothetical protein ALC62_12508 [Cyphomyrmex costatus]|uniref:Uncharacterized protein n=1 Tax=Cyphomyrmex costatus TaxID=456900 RepID=A0A195C967_9HYME|nr:hypothetical protein ALC62_12508 [Cyphomyrmex costatus]
MRHPATVAATDRPSVEEWSNGLAALRVTEERDVLPLRAPLVPLRQVRSGVNAPGSHPAIACVSLVWILCAFLHFRFSFLPLLARLCFVLRATRCIRVKGSFYTRGMEA